MDRTQTIDESIKECERYHFYVCNNFYCGLETQDATHAMVLCVKT